MAKSLLGRSLSQFEWFPVEVRGPLTEEAAPSAAYQHRTGLRVIESREEFSDKREWYHVSCSWPNRLPSYDDLQLMRKAFIGEDVTALQIFPPKRQYVNVHPYTLHLYHCITEEVVPDEAL